MLCSADYSWKHLSHPEERMNEMSALILRVSRLRHALLSQRPPFSALLTKPLGMEGKTWWGNSGNVEGRVQYTIMADCYKALIYFCCMIRAGFVLFYHNGLAVSASEYPTGRRNREEYFPAGLGGFHCERSESPGCFCNISEAPAELGRAPVGWEPKWSLKKAVIQSILILCVIQPAVLSELNAIHCLMKFKPRQPKTSPSPCAWNILRILVRNGTVNAK